MANLTETSTWVTPVTGVDNGDALDATELTTPETQLTKRTKYLRDYLPGARDATDVLVRLTEARMADGTYTGTPAVEVLHWMYTHGTTGTWIQHDVTGAWALAVDLPLNPGVTLTSLKLRCKGGTPDINPSHTALPATLPTLALVSANATTGALTTLATTTDPSATVAAYNLDHEIVVAGSYAISAAVRYMAVIRGEAGTNAEVDGFAVASLAMSWTAPASV